MQSSARVKSVTEHAELGVDTVSAYPHSSPSILDVRLLPHRDQAPEPMLPNFGSGKKRAFNMDITMLITCNAKERTLPEMISVGYVPTHVSAAIQTTLTIALPGSVPV